VRPHSAAMAVAGAMAFVLGTPVPIDSARWWRSRHVAEQLRLSPQQAAVIDGIYQGSLAQANACARDYAAARKHLDVLLMSDGVDDVFEVTTSRVADLEASCRRGRTLMLYRMFRQLSAEQRLALAELAGSHERRGADPDGAQRAVKAQRPVVRRP
jgi:hypothetical protein